MAAKKQQLAQIALAANATSTIYSTPVDTTTILKELTVCNPTDVDVLFSLAVVGLEGTGTTNYLFKEIYIAAGVTNIIGLSTIVPEGKGVVVKCVPYTTGGSLNIIASGVELINSTGKQLVVSTLTTSPQVLYTVPAVKTGVLYQAMICNVSDTSAMITMHIVPPGGTASNANAVLSEVTVDFGSSLLYTASTAMPEGSTIVAKSSAANAINLTIDGTEK